MRIHIHKFKSIIFLLMLLVVSGNVNAQCTVTGNVNTSTMPCSSYTGCASINIGNGTITTNLNFNADLDLTCLGAIQFIVKNKASINFGSSDRLYLGAGSSIIVETGGDISGASCNASERIYIGGVLFASCNGGGGATTTFSDIETFEGSGSVTSNSPVCAGNTINLSATPPPNGGPFTYTWYEPSVSSSTSIGTGQSISIASAVSGTHIYQVKMYSASLNKTMVINCIVVVNSGASSAAPTVTVTQPTCSVSTGTITITAPTGGMNYSIDGLIYTNTTGIFTSVAPGTYSVTAKNSSGCVSNATSVTIASPVKTWNGSVSADWNTAANWSPSGVPTSSNCVIVPNVVRFPIISGTNFVAYANTLTILDLGVLTVNPSNSIVVTDFVNVDSMGSFVLENTASLVQINNVNNSGYIDYKRTTYARKTDYTYWSSPVSPFTLWELYSLEGTYYSYEVTSSSEDWKQETSGTEMIAGKGFIANQGAEIPSGPTPPSNQLDVTFTGTPNNGHYEINGIFADKSYLLGNPYPSALDADAFLVANQGVLNGTLYFWTHNTAMQDRNSINNPGSGAFAYTSDDYAVYNATGGVGAAPPDLDPITGLPYPGSSPSGSAVPTGKIAAGQGFFASSKVSLSDSKIVFDNNMRVGVNAITGDNSQFFKTKNPKITKIRPVEKNRIWLNLTNIQGAFKQTLIGYLTDATNEYDERFDGESFDGNEFVDFYSVNQDKNLVIQGRALPFDEKDVVPLGYRSAINGEFSINIDQTDGLLNNQAVYLEDKLTNTVFDLKSGKYTFSTAAGTFDDRFVLRYTNNNTSKTLGTTDFDVAENKIIISSKNKQIKISSFEGKIESVEIYDLLGRQIYLKTNLNTNEQMISNLALGRQVLLIKIRLQSGEIISDKIIY